MRSLVENLDQTKEELLQRLQNATSSQKNEDSEKVLMAQDISNFKRDTLAKNAEIEDLKTSLASLDSNLDEIQSELDQKT